MAEHKTFIRVTPETRQKIKVLAAQRGVSMQHLIDTLVSQEIEREQKGDTKRNVNKDVSVSPLSQ